MYTTYVPSMCVKILSQYICIVNSRVCQYIRDATVSPKSLIFLSLSASNNFKRYQNLSKNLQEVER